MPVEPLLARQQAVEGGQQVVVRPGADLHDDEAGRRVRDEHRQQPVAAGGRVGRERGARPGQVEQPAARRPSGPSARASLREDAPDGVAQPAEAAAAGADS